MLECGLDGKRAELRRTRLLCWTASGTMGLTSRESSCFVAVILVSVPGLNAGSGPFVSGLRLLRWLAWSVWSSIVLLSRASGGCGLRVAAAERIARLSLSGREVVGKTVRLSL